MTEEKDLQARKDRLIKYCETVEPVSMVIEFEGEEPSLDMLRTAKELESIHGLPKPVVNVFIQYLYLKMQGKVYENYIEKTAKTIKLQKIITAESAMIFFKNQDDARKADQAKKFKKDGISPIFDYEKFKEELKEQQIPIASIEFIDRKTLSQISYLYSLSTRDLVHAFLMSVDDKLEVTSSKLNKSSAILYKMKEEPNNARNL